MLSPWKKAMKNLDRILKNREISLPTKVHLVKATVFPVIMNRCESWTIKKAVCWRIGASENIWWYFRKEKSLESPLDCKEIKPVNCNGNQSWIFIGRTDAEAPILWPSDAMSQLTRKDTDAGKDWKQEKKGTTENEMVGWHHWLNGHELSQLRELVMDREAWCAAVHGVTKSWTRKQLNSNNRWHGVKICSVTCPISYSYSGREAGLQSRHLGFWVYAFTPRNTCFCYLLHLLLICLGMPISHTILNLDSFLHFLHCYHF